MSVTQSPVMSFFAAINPMNCLKFVKPSPLLRSLPYRSIPTIHTKLYTTGINTIKKESDFNDYDVSASTTGVVDVDKSKEALLYFDHIYSRSVSMFKFVQYFHLWSNNNSTPAQVKDRILKLSSTDQTPLPAAATILDFVPLRRDSGAFVKFSVPEGMSCKELIGLICSNVLKNTEAKDLLLYYTSTQPRVYLVKGIPWIEDLRRFPSPKIKVKFEGEQLTEEELYVLFRRYGTIYDITPAGSLPFAVVHFKRIRSGICAKNCITGITLNEGKTTLHLQYLPIERVNYIANFISNHQRIAVPFILAIIATAAVLIFDPIRQFFIEEKIEHKLSLQHYKDSSYFKFFTRPILVVQNWFCSGYDYIGDTLRNRCDDTINNESNLDDEEYVNSNNLWTERNEKVKQLKLWIYENINTFIVVRGPKGSGKRELVVEDALMGDEELRKRILYLDCDEIVKARSEAKLIDALATQIGYYPVFSWLSSISQFIDVGVQGLTGQKSGLSESKETQIKNMLLLTSQAIRNVALNEYGAYEKLIRDKQRRQEAKKRKDPSMEFKPEEVMKPEEYLQQFAEKKPVVVINKFSSKSSNDTNDFMYKMISDWASTLVQNNTAHVVFVTSDVGSVQHLNASLPNQVFKTITLNDASESSSFYYVMNQLKGMRYLKFNPDIIKDVMKPIGGRMLDLQAFIRRIKSGESPHESLEEMVSQAAEQITTFFLFNDTKSGDIEYKNWDPLQVWDLIKQLSKSDTIQYNELTKSPLFKVSNETISTLSALEKNDLIALKREKGVLSEITTGRPIYKEAFKTLVEDEDIYKAFELSTYNNLIKLETAKIHSFEDELSKVPFKDYKLDNRLKYLVEKIDQSNDKVTNYETIVNDIKKGNHKNSSFLKIF